MNEYIKLIQYGITVIPSILLLYFLMNPDKLEHWTKILYDVICRLGILGKYFDRSHIALFIQDSVNGACEQINKEAPDILPHALKISWVKSETSESFIKKGEVIVRLKYYENRDRNIVDSTLLYLKRGFLPISKQCLDETLSRSCEFKVATRIFSAIGNTGAFSYFMNNELKPACENNPNLYQDLQMLEDLDSVGFFTQVFLREVNKTGERIPTPAIQKELRNFAEFLQIIANKAWNEDVPLTFEGVRVKTAIVLVAREETIQLYGIAPYITAISMHVRKGYNSVYIGGWGKEFIDEVINIKNRTKEFLTLLRQYDNIPIECKRKGIQAKGILVVCQPNFSYLAQKRELKNEVKQAMIELIPEIENGEVEVVSIARIKNIGCKIAVRMAAGGDVSEATGACIGERGERVEALKNRLHNEFVSIVAWSDDIKEFIINAITYKEFYLDVDPIKIDEKKLIANVKVKTEEAYKKALGVYHSNIKLANELTGWAIYIEEPGMTPEEELREIIIRYIPEIENKEIEIVRLARIKDIGSKIAVRWKNKDIKRSTKAYQVCRGYNDTHVKTIQLEETIGEYLYFNDWSDDPKELIIRFLFPLKSSDVKFIDLDDKSNTAFIMLSDIKESPPFWRNKYNLELAERVTGWKIKIKETL